MCAHMVGIKNTMVISWLDIIIKKGVACITALIKIWSKLKELEAMIVDMICTLSMQLGHMYLKIAAVPFLV